MSNSVLKIYNFIMYLLLWNVEQNLALEQYPCKCTESFFKKSCSLSCFTGIYSPLKKKSINPTLSGYLDAHFSHKNFKSVFRTTDQCCS